MQDMINYDHRFIVNEEKIRFTPPNMLYYIEFLEDEKTIVWWQDEGEWECNKDYSRSYFEEMVGRGIWVIQ